MNAGDRRFSDEPPAPLACDARIPDGTGGNDTAPPTVRTGVR
ncbi:hypothetical protein BVI2075_140033 [Burkholderia vietnamiensis]|nr:hypothetical protein BVI2075_140033 [Burkholderia vietnamiensis]